MLCQAMPSTHVPENLGHVAVFQWGTLQTNSFRLLTALALPHCSQKHLAVSKFAAKLTWLIFTYIPLPSPPPSPPDRVSCNPDWPQVQYVLEDDLLSGSAL